MQILVKMQVFDTYSNEEEEYAKKVFGNQLQYILESGKVSSCGVFADSCGGFFILDINDSDELTDLVSPALLHNMHIEVHHTMPVEKFSEYFKKPSLSD